MTQVVEIKDAITAEVLSEALKNVTSIDGKGMMMVVNPEILSAVDDIDNIPYAVNTGLFEKVYLRRDIEVVPAGRLIPKQIMESNQLLMSRTTSISTSKLGKKSTMVHRPDSWYPFGFRLFPNDLVTNDAKTENDVVRTIIGKHMNMTFDTDYTAKSDDCDGALVFTYHGLLDFLTDTELDDDNAEIRFFTVSENDACVLPNISRWKADDDQTQYMILKGERLKAIRKFCKSTCEMIVGKDLNRIKEVLTTGKNPTTVHEVFAMYFLNNFMIGKEHNIGNTYADMTNDDRLSLLYNQISWFWCARNTLNLNENQLLLSGDKFKAVLHKPSVVHVTAIPESDAGCLEYYLGKLNNNIELFTNVVRLSLKVYMRYCQLTPNMNSECLVCNDITMCCARLRRFYAGSILNFRKAITKNGISKQSYTLKQQGFMGYYYKPGSFDMNSPFGNLGGSITRREDRCIADVVNEAVEKYESQQFSNPEEYRVAMEHINASIRANMSTTTIEGSSPRCHGATKTVYSSQLGSFDPFTAIATANTNVCNLAGLHILTNPDTGRENDMSHVMNFISDNKKSSMYSKNVIRKIVDLGVKAFDTTVLKCTMTDADDVANVCKNDFEFETERVDIKKGNEWQLRDCHTNYTKIKLVGIGKFELNETTVYDYPQPLTDVCKKTKRILRIGHQDDLLSRDSRYMSVWHGGIIMRDYNDLLYLSAIFAGMENFKLTLSAPKNTGKKSNFRRFGNAGKEQRLKPALFVSRKSMTAMDSAQSKSVMLQNWLQNTTLTNDNRTFDKTPSLVMCLTDASVYQSPEVGDADFFRICIRDMSPAMDRPIMTNITLNEMFDLDCNRVMLYTPVNGIYSYASSDGKQMDSDVFSPLFNEYNQGTISLQELCSSVYSRRSEYHEHITLLSTRYGTETDLLSLVSTSCMYLTEKMSIDSPDIVAFINIVAIEGIENGQVNADALTFLCDTLKIVLENEVPSTEAAHDRLKRSHVDDDANNSCAKQHLGKIIKIAGDDDNHQTEDRVDDGDTLVE